ncbi:hypothetical protein ES703_117589 [subsurface metagenome]
MNVAMTMAVAPIIGGVICPPLEHTASIAPASSGLNPASFIAGMVNDPVKTTFAEPLPETMATRLLPSHAI